MLQRLFKRPPNRETLLAILFFALNVFLVFSIFIPMMRDINTWDESVYVNTGRSLVRGELPPFSRNPLIGLFYAALYLIFSGSPFWMLYSISLGRFLLFGLMWLSAYLIARQFARSMPPLAMAGPLLLFPVLVDILLNPSDALFAALSGFALWQVLGFYNDQDRSHLWKASLFLGLAALSRNDGLVLFVIFLFLAALIVRSVRWDFRWLIPAVIPFAALVGGYLLLFAAVTGGFEMGTMQRSYVAFQQGQSVDYKREPGCQQKLLKCAVLKAQELYGTGEENGYSVFRAISRNPQAFASRLANILGALPSLVVDTFGKRMIFLALILAARGIWELLAKRKFLLLAILLLWMTHLGVYFLTFFRIGYIRTIYFVPFLLIALGAYAFVQDMSQRRRAYALIGLFLTATVTAVFLDVRALYFTTALLSAALLGIHLFQTTTTDEPSLATMGLLALLTVSLILRPIFDPPVGRDLSQGAEEQALLVMVDSLPKDATVAAGSPGGVWAADMQFEDLGGDEYYAAASPAELHDLLVQKGITAVYVDSSLSNANEPIWKLIESQLDQYYTTVYSGREGSIRLLLVK